MRAGARLWLLAGLPLVLGACAVLAPPPELSPARREALVIQHRRKAAALEQSGDLTRALDEWKIALTIDPDDSAAQAGRKKLEARIEQAVADRLRQGREALERGVPVEARRQFLAALALDPANQDAFAALRAEATGSRVAPDATPSGRASGAASGEAQEVNPLLADATDSLEAREFEVAIADVDKLLADSPGLPEGIELKKAILYGYGKAQLDDGQYAGSYRALADLAKLDPKYLDAAALREQVKSRLIQDLYQEGIRLYRDENLEGAITKWRAVLEYDPNQTEARKNIEQAERLLRALQQRRRDAQ